MIQINAVSLTDEERKLLNDLLNIASAFLANVYGQVKMDNYDASIVQRLNRPEEIKALIFKLNRDKFLS